MKRAFEMPNTARTLLAATGLALMGLAVPAQAADDADYTVVTDQETFKARFIGPKIMDPQDSANYFVIQEDGTITGTWFGKEMAGAWRWEDGFFCRSLSAPRAAPEDCQQWSHADGMARLVRSRGAGEATDYALGE